MQTRENIQSIIDNFGPMIWRLCLIFFEDPEDVQQAYAQSIARFAALPKPVSFKDDEYRKAWLVRATTNTCKDLLEIAGKPLDDKESGSLDDQKQMDAIIALIPIIGAVPADFTMPSTPLYDLLRVITEPPRVPTYLVLGEDYDQAGVAKILKVGANTMFSWIARGKKLLRDALKISEKQLTEMAEKDFTETTVPQSANDAAWAAIAYMEEHADPNDDIPKKLHPIRYVIVVIALVFIAFGVLKFWGII